jgi:hypothetical protein
MAARSGLNAGLFIGRQDKLILLQALSLPEPLVKVKEAPCFERKVGIARKDPTAVLPRTNGILVEPAPDGALTDAGHQTGATHVMGDLGYAQSRQRQLQLGR